MFPWLQWKCRSVSLFDDEMRRTVLSSSGYDIVFSFALSPSPRRNVQLGLDLSRSLREGDLTVPW